MNEPTPEDESTGMQPQESGTGEVVLTIGTPKRFTWKFKLLCLAPVVALIAIVSLPGIIQIIALDQTAGWIGRTHGIRWLNHYFTAVFGFLIMWGAICLLVYYISLPLFVFSPIIEGWFAKKRQRLQCDGALCFVVEIALKPRVHKGVISSLIEDADDVGILAIRNDGLLIEGDSIGLHCSWHRIASLKVRYTKFSRGAWVSGKDFHFRFASPIEGRKGFMLRIREGKTIFHTRSRSRELQALLEARMEQEEDRRASPSHSDLA